MGLEHQPLSEAIIGAAITVYRELGPGFVEQICENALSLERQARGIPIQRQLPVAIVGSYLNAWGS